MIPNECRDVHQLDTVYCSNRATQKVQKASILQTLQLVELLKLCLDFKILEVMLHWIDEGFCQWVEEYKR